MMASMLNHHVLQVVIDAVYLCAACREGGVVEIGITRAPLERVLRAHGGAVVIAAQWAWVGNAAKGKTIERRLRETWAGRHRAGAGFLFDYATEGAEFRRGLNAAFEASVGQPADWRKASPEDLDLMLRQERATRRKRDWRHA